MNDEVFVAIILALCLMGLYNILWIPWTLFRVYAIHPWARWLVTRQVTRRPPDFVIGTADNPYMLRWFVIPRNRWFNIYVHHILRDDDPRALHDHPWINCSIVAFGSYGEVLPNRFKIRRSGDVVFRLPRNAHRLVLDRVGDWPAQSCQTVFITGPRVRVWGFLCPKGWVDYKTFTNPADYGQIGQGCGED